MLAPTDKFIGLADRAVLMDLEKLEKEFLAGNMPLDTMRKEVSGFYNLVSSEMAKKIILMEYDGLEIKAKRSVT